jgi:hypothetical protein
VRLLQLLFGLLFVVPLGAVVVWSRVSDSEIPVVGGWLMLAPILGAPPLMLLAAADAEMLVGASQWRMLAFFLIVPTFLFLVVAKSADWRGNRWQLTRAWRK